MDLVQDIRNRLQVIMQEDEVDDSLVKYIEVLARNGKHKKELEEKLEDFLGKKTIEFCEWLVQHQSSRNPPPAKRMKTDESGEKDTKQTKDSVSNHHVPSEKITIHVKPQEHREVSSSDSSSENGKANPSSSSPKITITLENRKRKANDGQPVTFKVNLPETPPSLSESSSARQVMIFSTDSRDRTEKESDTSDRTSKRDESERSSIPCQYWPACKKGKNCPFRHPAEECLKFPDCPYGSHCKFVHPKIPCRNGAYCKNSACNYTHNPTSNSSTSKRDCRFGFSCSSKSSCPFWHPLVACKYGNKCERGPACKYGHSPLCRYGSACHTAGCRFSHPELEGDIDHDVHRISQSLPSTP